MRSKKTKSVKPKRIKSLRQSLKEEEKSRKVERKREK
jgi:hypothetical protein